jgi:penicillin-binding protein 2
MMVSQGGTGSLTSGPSVRKIYEAIFGVEGTNVRPANSVLAGGLPASTLPKIGKDGAVATNEGTDRANKNVLKRYGRTAAIL